MEWSCAECGMIPLDLVVSVTAFLLQEMEMEIEHCLEAIGKVMQDSNG